MTRQILIISAACALVTLTSWTARADGDDAMNETASKLYAEATEARSAKQWDVCYAKAKSAWAINKHRRIAGTIGDCALSLGHYPEAATFLARFVREAKASDPADGRAHIEARLKEAQTRVATVTVSVNVPDARIVVDDAPLVEHEHAIYLEPGKHTFEAHHQSRESAIKSVTLDAGATTRVDLELLPKPPPNGNGHEPIPKPSGVDPYPVLLTVGGVLAAGSLAAAVALLVVAGNESDDANTRKQELLATGGCPAPCRDVADKLASADTFYNASGALFIAGGVLASATIIYAIAGAPDEHAGVVQIVPIHTGSLWGVAAWGSF